MHMHFSILVHIYVCKNIMAAYCCPFQEDSPAVSLKKNPFDWKPILESHESLKIFFTERNNNIAASK